LVEDKLFRLRFEGKKKHIGTDSHIADALKIVQSGSIGGFKHYRTLCVRQDFFSKSFGRKM
jgi:hypothetical protein